MLRLLALGSIPWMLSINSLDIKLDSMGATDSFVEFALGFASVAVAFVGLVDACFGFLASGQLVCVCSSASIAAPFAECIEQFVVGTEAFVLSCCPFPLSFDLKKGWSC